METMTMSFLYELLFGAETSSYRPGNQQAFYK